MVIEQVTDGHGEEDPDLDDDDDDDDDEERRRLFFRQRLQRDMGWAIRKASAPTKLQVIDRLDDEVSFHAVTGLPASRQLFIDALIAIRDVARRVDSPFAASFELARHLADSAAAHPPGPMRAPDSGYPSELRDRADQAIALWAGFGCGAGHALGLAGVAIADVFGGMGSWNDQGFEGDDERVYQTLSAGLFAALNRYYEALSATTALPRSV